MQDLEIKSKFQYCNKKPKYYLPNTVLKRKEEWLLGDLPLHIIIMTSVMSLKLLFNIE